MQATEQPIIDYKQLYELQLAVLEKLVQQLAAQEDRLAAMSAEIARLRKLIFTVKAERFVPASDATASELQLALDLQAETVAHCKLTSATTVEYVRTTVEVVPATPKAHPGRMKLPDHLRREVILLKPEGDVSGLRRMGEDVTEILDYIPAELYVKQYIRPKYAAPGSNFYSKYFFDAQCYFFGNYVRTVYGQQDARAEQVVAGEVVFTFEVPIAEYRFIVHEHEMFTVPYAEFFLYEFQYMRFAVVDNAIVFPGFFQDFDIELRVFFLCFFIGAGSFLEEACIV